MSEKKVLKALEKELAGHSILKFGDSTHPPLYFTVGPEFLKGEKAPKTKFQIGAGTVWDEKADVVAWFRVKSSMYDITYCSHGQADDDKADYTGQLLGPEDILTLRGTDCEVTPGVVHTPQIKFTPEKEWELGEATILVGCVYTAQELLGTKGKRREPICYMIHPVKGGLAHMYDRDESGIPFANFQVDMKMKKSSGGYTLVCRGWVGDPYGPPEADKVSNKKAK